MLDEDYDFGFVLWDNPYDEFYAWVRYWYGEEALEDLEVL